VQSGYIGAEQMQQALVETRKSGGSLVEILQKLTGRPLPPDLQRQYKKNQLFELKILYGVESIDPELSDVDGLEIARLIDSLIPIDLCRRYRLIPLRRIEGEPASILIAMVDPDNLEATDDINRILRPRELSLQRLVITSEDYERLLEKFHWAQPELEREKARLENKILAKALQEGTSDIHIEPQEEFLKIRFRKDGVLHQAFDPLPKRITPAVTARFKIMAELDIAERRLPQDGKIRRIYQGRKVDFRVNTLPSRYGEKVCLRILDNSSTQLGLDKLITDQKTLQIVRDLASHPFGLLLVTGPTGSGKSTTLYSVLAERNHPGVNISTAEDPIEYSLPGITQVQVIREKGMDFASILRAFMALTGHLVLTTLHTNDAAGAIARLDEMGVETFMISGSLLGVLAQRLMRRVCTECRVAYHPTQEELARFGLSAANEQEVTFYRANTLTIEEIQQARREGNLCVKCNGSGYKGR